VEQLTDILLNKRLGGCGGSMQDGAVGAKTAAFFEPYVGEPENFGRLYYPEDQLISDLRGYYKKGFQFTSHAIGTAAIERIVNANDVVLTENTDFDNRLRNRIDHFEFPTEEQVETAIGKLNLLVVPQPGFSWMDENFPGMGTYRKYLSPEIVDMQIPLKTIYEMGGIICGSSDAPVQEISPFLQIHGMVNFPIVNERLNVYQAFRTYTYNAAYATFEENIRGTLSSGKKADFIVLEDDPFKIPEDKLIELKVERTFVNGMEIHNLEIDQFKDSPVRNKI
jgi:predicted amidohydrolase YtcJ